VGDGIANRPTNNFIRLMMMIHSIVDDSFIRPMIDFHSCIRLIMDSFYIRDSIWSSWQQVKQQ